MLRLHNPEASVENQPEFQKLHAEAYLPVPAYGNRARCLVRLLRLEMPVPAAVALSFATVRGIAAGHMPDVAAILSEFGADPVVSVRSSPENPDWGGPGTILNIGLNDLQHARLANLLGDDAASSIYGRFVQSYAIHVARLDPEMFEPRAEDGLSAGDTLRRALDLYEDEMDEPFPQEPADQLAQVLKSMARAWEGTTAHILRQAKGAPADAGLGLIVQRMALGLGPGECGAGVMQCVSSTTGAPRITGRYRSQAQGREALHGENGAFFLTKDPRGPSLEEICPDAFADLKRYATAARRGLRDELQVEFTIEGGEAWILDAASVPRSSRAAVRIAVDLANDGIIPHEEALLRVEPRALTELMHPQVDPDAVRDVLARGIAASPGAATGRIVLTSDAAQASASRGEPCILVRHETSPEDVRGMHAASGVLTERGGATSHAAVIARGIGVPCVVGATDLRLDTRKRKLVARDGRVFREGDVITLDGSAGEVLAGEVPTVEATVDDALASLMDWADEARDISVRANADTPAEARVARSFKAEGIGLCRTEHMFFEEDRLTVMREMIFADDTEDRRAALDRLLPMQRADFVELFEIMQGQPVCIRLFDPPLHEFLPNDRDAMRDLAEAMDLPLSQVIARIEDLQEFNPMLGMRGVRLGITVPEIYEMQARAIFEATVEASRNGDPVVPEVMVPLVSARREVELVRNRVDAVAAAVRNESGARFAYKLGVMVETPRAALRAGDIAGVSDFLSFGTNDLTQMTYGLSRDDAGRFMSTYVNLGVFPEDPFHTLDPDGVGELLLIGAERGRAAESGLNLSICGEHAGSAESIAFCRRAGFDYVSCSPFRVPVARLAAAQIAVRERAESRQDDGKTTI
ncbi:pyruvate, phosphate dikinase [Maritimibacter sp. 55A14]|uniref:pyruvate, phosphate dikinase n=1 Tax=Maritimibacter sp. 55A14 TaxID=2174844 RepID=UPI000D605665|nr:pyruvate, phosphate dikinase [Maritimibacter sp. 55A14]PWE33672.1 pyruvate, phosphate dikinase [Maritimibacter sp. 55A14]